MLLEPVNVIEGTGTAGTGNRLNYLLEQLAVTNINQLRQTEQLKNSLVETKEHLRIFPTTDALKDYVTEHYNCHLYHALFQLLPSCKKFISDVGPIGYSIYVTDEHLNTVKNRFASVNQEDGYTLAKRRYFLKDDSSFKFHIYNMVILTQDNVEAKKRISKIRKMIATKISKQLTMVTTFLFSETDNSDYSSCSDVEFVGNDNANDNDSSVSNNNDNNNDNNSNDSDNNDNDLEGDDVYTMRHGNRDADEGYVTVHRNYSKEHVMEAFEKELNNGKNDDNIIVVMLLL